MNQFVIIKRNHDYKGGRGYAGPACKKAGIAPGKVYTSLYAAGEDILKLNAVTKSRFLISRYKEKENVQVAS